MKKLMIFLVVFVSATASADRLLPPENPEQTLAYWKPYIIQAESSTKVSQAHAVFTDLLKTWDDSRIEPVLHVVRSNSGPWAASLLDGTILLSESAIESCVQIAGRRYRHLLAFILAHELAHQRSDDLWHFKFFRLVGAQKPALQEKLLEGFSLNREKLQQIEKQEAQADQEGLTLMTLVGYDAAEITTHHDFFKAWVETIWQRPCDQSQFASKEISAICKQAGVRAARARAHLKKLALDTSLYQLGVEAYVSGDYRKARKYFKAYGRLFPGNVVHNSIGLTYLAEVMEINRTLYKVTGKTEPGFIYPVMLDLQPVLYQPKRGVKNSVIIKLKQDKNRLINLAVKVFERSIRLAPAYRPAYLHLVISYILNKNQPMANGVLLGKYKQRFGEDFEFKLLTALILASNNTEPEQLKAKNILQELTRDVLKLEHGYSDVQVFSAVKNTAAVLTLMNKNNLDADEVKQYWETVARRAKQLSDPSLFLLAVKELNQTTAALLRNQTVFPLNSQKVVAEKRRQLKKEADSFWFEGEKIYRVKNAEGDRLLFNDQGKILSKHIVASQGKLEELGLFTQNRSSELSRIYTRYGIPDRRVFLLNGQYVAYDKPGVAIQLQRNKIVGWFYY